MILIRRKKNKKVGKGREERGVGNTTNTKCYKYAKIHAAYNLHRVFRLVDSSGLHQFMPTSAADSEFRIPCGGKRDPLVGEN